MNTNTYFQYIKQMKELVDKYEANQQLCLKHREIIDEKNKKIETITQRCITIQDEMCQLNFDNDIDYSRTYLQKYEELKGELIKERAEMSAVNADKVQLENIMNISGALANQIKLVRGKIQILKPVLNDIRQSVSNM